MMKEHGRNVLILTSLVCTYMLLTSTNSAAKTSNAAGVSTHESVTYADPPASQLPQAPPILAFSSTTPSPLPPPPTPPKTLNKAAVSQTEIDTNTLDKWSGDDLDGRYTGVHDAEDEEDRNGLQVQRSNKPHEVLPNISHSFDTTVDTSFVIATGASSDHSCWLVNMLASLHKRRPEWQVVVYDLGLEGDLNYTYLNMVHPKGIQLRRFQYANYPDYFRIDQNAGEYAWKPIIIKEMVDEFGSVLWLDSGNNLGKRDNLTFVKDQLDSVGFYSPHSVGSLAKWTHPKTLKHFGIHPDEVGLAPYNDKSNCNGAFVGFSKDSAAYQKLLVPWVNCAYNRNCIAPPGSNRGNHRQDQAALTVLVHQNGYKCYPECKQGCHGITLHIDGMGWAKNVCNLMKIPNLDFNKKKKKK